MLTLLVLIKIICTDLLFLLIITNFTDLAMNALIVSHNIYTRKLYELGLRIIINDTQIFSIVSGSGNSLDITIFVIIISVG